MSTNVPYQFAPVLFTAVQIVTVIQAEQAAGNLFFVPYYAWSHRGMGELTVWLQRAKVTTQL